MKSVLAMLVLAVAASASASVWPQPATMTTGPTVLEVDPSLKFVLDGGRASPILSQAFTRYAKIMFAHDTDGTTRNRDGLSALKVTVDDMDESHPQLETDESYSLSVDATASNLKAKTVYGALRGLETLSQLVAFNFTTQKYFVADTPIQIVDAPRFPHRGLMMDTARHFETLATIYKVVDSLPYAKVNVLHWHIVDSQSYPFQSKSHPKLWDGAYSGQERYTQRDIADVVEYARLRGVRVMVEFDMPGHAESWCAGYPEICPSSTCKTPLNVANNATFDLITDVLRECTGGKTSQKGAPSGLFPDNFIHLGGDEVNTGCWSQNPQISKWLDQHGMSPDDGYAYFVKRAAQIALDQGRRPVQWVEVFDHFYKALDKKTVVHVWKDKSTLVNVTSAGYNALINNSPGDNSWYLDHLNIKWDAVYGNEPCSALATQEQCDLVLGGQGEMWGETVDTSDIEQTVWPKMAAIAERLWSPRSVNDTAAALPRLERFRCLLNRRGVRAAPVNNANARSSPPGPGSCFDQR